MSVTKTIFKHYPVTSETCRLTLEVIDNLVEGDSFLCGLGDQPPKVEKEFLATNDLAEFEQMLMGFTDTCGEDYDPYPENFQHMCNMLHHTSVGVSDEHYNKVSGLLNEAMGSYSGYIINKVEQRLEEIDFSTAVLNKSGSSGEYNVTSFADYVITDVDAQIYYMAYTAYFSGLGANPFFQRMYDLYCTGGMPCGWPGVRPNKAELVNESNVKDNMVMLHFGI